jgi:homoserine O-acetyltransferase/O-succinyltransferase
MPDWISQATSASHDIPGFEFTDGRRLDLTIGYRTVGTLDEDRANAVLMLHGTTGTGQQFLAPNMADALFAPGAPLDVTRYFVILPDAIGHGGSSRPSDGLGPAFPRYGYADIVASTHHLVTEGLGIEHLRLLLGTSMGGMQTWMWGERYPEMPRALMAVASLPERVAGRNLLWRRMLIDLIRSDPAYADGHYERQPASVGQAMTLFSLMVASPARLGEEISSIEEADARITQTQADALASEDANDVIWEFDASYDYDPSPQLEAIQAPFLAVNFADDELNPIELGVLEDAISRVARGRSVIVPADPNSRGHQTLRVAKAWSKYVAELLDQTADAPIDAPRARAAGA